jgi:polysaccharide pyruvyl transferase WcaK-like protein
MKARTRFSLADFEALKSEAQAVRERLSRLGRHLLDANLAHTKAQFYDSDVRSVADRLSAGLSGLDGLLYREDHKHTLAKAELTV